MKKIWIMNHYASHMLFDKGGRHYNFAKYLNWAGYEPVVFCANIMNNRTMERCIDTENLWTIKNAEEINTPFVYVKARKYVGNGKQRVLNMMDFYHNVKKTAKEYADQYGKPDIILASSVHPLTMVAGIQLAKKFGVKCICEVRDLWPESIVAYSSKWTKNSILMRLLYQGEKWIYKKADAIIMTWSGGYDYIIEQGWDRQITSDKVVYIGNGVELKVFNELASNNSIDDDNLNDANKKKFIYTGSIGKVNNLRLIVEAAKILKFKGNTTALVLIYGSGEEEAKLREVVDQYKLDNIIFKGRVPKCSIPEILRKADFTLLHNSSTSLDKYGQSQNKFFEYLAAGHPILMTYTVGHSIIQDQQCGVELQEQSPEAIAEAIEMLCGINSAEYKTMSDNAKREAKKHDFRILTDELISVMENVN